MQEKKNIKIKKSNNNKRRIKLKRNVKCSATVYNDYPNSETANNKRRIKLKRNVKCSATVYNDYPNSETANRALK